eukprot:CAMPEP_0168494676 /NCGR_PEP_ID=MMETSP0228-20121227/71349_1 /TAXON_ID=133427 /ORGANISM="Protoceratium reticulatum, Strain CCCM 535 (=CCMP 1889)" /LENGTH=166 /DNA_ID=CAMNT_0008511481 /DNA_START=519 /DNA_END=1021 /DNA_ORIENTATION=+
MKPELTTAHPSSTLSDTASGSEQPSNSNAGGSTMRSGRAGRNQRQTGLEQTAEMTGAQDVHRCAHVTVHTIAEAKIGPKGEEDERHEEIRYERARRQICWTHARHEVRSQHVTPGEAHRVAVHSLRAPGVAEAVVEPARGADTLGRVLPEDVMPNNGAVDRSQEKR